MEIRIILEETDQLKSWQQLQTFLFFFLHHEYAHYTDCMEDCMGWQCCSIFCITKSEISLRSSSWDSPSRAMEQSLTCKVQPDSTSLLAVSRLVMLIALLPAWTKQFIVGDMGEENEVWITGYILIPFWPSISLLVDFQISWWRFCLSSGHMFSALCFLAWSSFELGHV